MKKTRRDFLKIGSASALGLGLAPAAGAGVVSDSVPAATPAADLPPLPSSVKQWGMVIDTRRFQSSRDLEPLITACRRAHNIPVHANVKHEIKWIWEAKYHNAFPDQPNQHLSEIIEHRPIPVLCNHCANPPCVRVCPTKATFKREDGIVIMDFHRCIGCRFCMGGCPFGARSFNFVDPRPAIAEADYNPAFPTRTKGVVEKCNFCAERIARGLYPACVEASNGAIVFGDLEDPQSNVRKILRSNFTLRRRPSMGTEPSVYYILG